MRRREGAKAKKEQKQQCEKCKKKERLRARTRQRRRDLGTPAAKVETEKKSSAGANVTWSTGGKHEARGPNPALHLVVSGRHFVSTQRQH